MRKEFTFAAESETKGGAWKLEVEAGSLRSVDESSEDEEDGGLFPVSVVHNDMLKKKDFVRKLDAVRLSLI